jgi:hypothetical protein
LNAPLGFGIRANPAQVLHQLLQVLLVGLTIGMMRNVVPALAQSEFGVPRGSFMLLVTVAMALSGALLLWWGEETHPRLNPAG